MPQRSLESLFLAYLHAGDQAAFEQLSRRCAPALRRLARRLGADAEDAEDLIQETLVAAIDGAERFQPERPLLPWLKGILTFRAAKLARARVRRRRRFGEWLAEPAASGPSPAEQSIGGEFAHEVRTAITRLPPPLQAPLQQFLLHGHSPLEIAAAAGQARATVRVRLHRGLARLRELLARWSALLVALWSGAQLPARSVHRSGRRVLSATAVVVAGIVVAGSLRWGAVHAPEPDAVAAIAAHAAPAPTSAAGGASIAASAPPVDVAAVPRREAAGEPGLDVSTVDRLGRPVANVAVVLQPVDGRDPVLQRRSVVTDATGRARVPALAPGAVSLRTDRGASLLVQWPEHGPRVTIDVPPGRLVRGRVVDAVGQPVAGAQVWLSDDTGGPWRGTDVVATDADGAFLLQHVPVGAFLAARHARWARSDVVRVPADGEDVPLQLHELGGTAVVMVVDADGRGLPDQAVFVGEAMDGEPLWLAQGAAPWRAPPFAGRTDADGAFRSGALAPGRHPIAVRGAGRQPLRASVDIEPGQCRALRLVSVPGTRLHGRVVDAAGRPLVGEVVLRTGDPRQSVDVATTGDGQFEFEGVAPGLVDIGARAADHTPTVVTVEIAGASTRRIELRLQRERQLVGSVVRLDGGPPPACEVRAEWPAQALMAGSSSAEVAAAGQFALPVRGDGVPRFSARVRGDVLWQRLAPVVGFEPLRLELPSDFAGRGRLRGELLRDDGAPLAGARLFLHRAGQAWAEVGCTAADGQFACGPLPIGRYTVYAETTDAAAPTLVVPDIDIEPGATRELRAVAPESGEVEVELVRADGAPVGDLAVTLVDARWQRRACCHTAARFRQRLLPGSYQLHVMGSRVRWRENVPVDIVAGQVAVVQVVLEPAVRTTLSLTGLPPLEQRTGATVCVRQRHTDWRAEFTLTADAPLRLAAMLAPGDYDLVYTDADGCEWRGAFVRGGDDAPSAIVVPVVAR